MSYYPNNYPSYMSYQVPTSMFIEIDGEKMEIFNYKTERNISSTSTLYHIPDQYNISFASYKYKNINKIHFGIIRNENLEYRLHGLSINRIDYIHSHNQHATYFYEGIDYVEVVNRTDKMYWREKKLKRILDESN
ncbi:hypothetical protein M0Q97_02965 [Candidatus Dojkabacteria bacterium]|jgi:hypothetical protein|nr:hypothetical protein [Candidatus Dojkabacteria bacterium]